MDQTYEECKALGRSLIRPEVRIEIKIYFKSDLTAKFDTSFG